MNIRHATIADMDRCAALESSYATDYVWQMDESITADSVSVVFRRTRIPRRMEVTYPRGTQDLSKDLLRNECFFVADEPGVVFAYLDLTVRRWQRQGWLEHLVVHPDYRRRGLATHLLEAARQWARASDLAAIVSVVQTKNDPAICLFAKLGYVFSGFIDRYYNNGDIGVLHSLRL